jgi:hypothetical protein
MMMQQALKLRSPSGRKINDGAAVVHLPEDQAAQRGN